MHVYADHAATTKVSPKVLEAMMPFLTDAYGNPSSLYRLGQEAKESLDQARAEVAEALGAKPREIVFTSGGTEADNLAIFSAARAGKKKGKTHLISTVFEHHAVLHPLQALENEGFEVTYLPVDAKGMVSLKDLEAALREETALVSIMAANNEIGSLQAIQDIGNMLKARGILFHSDAVQAVGHIPVDVDAWQVDYLSLSGHKFHGPKGVGALYVRSGSPITPLLYGGGQEANKRSGTENLPGIIGMAAALREAVDGLAVSVPAVTALRDRLIHGLQAIDHAALNGHESLRLPGNVSFCFEGIEGESLLLLLDDAGIAASSGSACSSGSLDPSHVLMAIGRSHQVAHGSLRLTLGVDTTEAEVDYLIDEVTKAVHLLRSMSPLWRDLVDGKEAFVL